RAIDTALPLLGPGRSLRFALLPEGQDPDDLARSGGVEAVRAVLSAALPLVDLIWTRETEQGGFATPERRAGLERRLAEIARDIKDETLRRYYEAEFKARLAGLFGTGAVTGQATRRNGFRGEGLAARSGTRGGAQRGRPATGNFREKPPVSASLASSALFRPSRTSIPARESLILLLLLAHPSLLDRYVEDIAELEFAAEEANILRGRLLVLAGSALADAADLRAHVEREGLGAILRKLDSITAHASHWYLQPDAADSDAEEVLKQAMLLHRRARALHRELQLAELALGMEASEVNLGRLKDIQEQLSALGGTEAAVEGFGALSGRENRTL
ncbi:MAG TPA: DNA primase, partial [Beijerinckia sp.]|nr:DNA primase [Beijerinckia sp.]